MKKLKWIALFIMVLALATNIKASNCRVSQQKDKTGAVVKAQETNAPATLIEQILFPHGI